MGVHYRQEVEARNSGARANLERKKERVMEILTGVLNGKLDCLLTTFFPFIQH